MNESAFGAQAYLEDLIAEGYRHLPICRELVADFETPLSCYVKVARGPYSYLLESANQGGEKWSRYSIIGLPARRVVRISGYELTLFDQGQVIRSERIEDPLA
jgi:anthranilate synthase component 1